MLSSLLSTPSPIFSSPPTSALQVAFESKDILREIVLFLEDADKTILPRTCKWWRLAVKGIELVEEWPVLRWPAQDYYTQIVATAHDDIELFYCPPSVTSLDLMEWSCVGRPIWSHLPKLTRLKIPSNQFSCENFPSTLTELDAEVLSEEEIKLLPQSLTKLKCEVQFLGHGRLPPGLRELDIEVDDWTECKNGVLPNGLEKLRLVVADDLGVAHQLFYPPSLRQIEVVVDFLRAGFVVPDFVEKLMIEMDSSAIRIPRAKGVKVLVVDLPKERRLTGCVPYGVEEFHASNSTSPSETVISSTPPSVRAVFSLDDGDAVDPHNGMPIPVFPMITTGCTMSIRTPSK